MLLPWLKFWLTEALRSGSIFIFDCSKAALSPWFSNCRCCTSKLLAIPVSIHCFRLSFVDVAACPYPFDIHNAAPKQIITILFIAVLYDFFLQLFNALSFRRAG